MGCCGDDKTEPLKVSSIAGGEALRERIILLLITRVANVEDVTF